MNILFTWLGKTDIDNMKLDKNAAVSSIATKSTRHFDKVVILANAWEENWLEYQEWLKKKLAIAHRPFDDVAVFGANIKSPIDYATITIEVHHWLTKLTNQENHITINLTSGTPAMTAVSILIGKGIVNCKFMQAAPSNEIFETDIPVDFSATYKKSVTAQIASKTSLTPHVENSFKSFIANSAAMHRVIYKAQKLAFSDLSVLILGESGTGKELMANAIHHGSNRASKNFRAINCGALPENLVDSILFGHVKGAFTGAEKDHQGIFQQADGGTLFLDEVGELPLNVQVKLLRVLQQGEITKVGDDKTISIDVRIIAATHRDLMAMVETNQFREDLFYRLAVGVLKIPPLRSRKEDIEPLVDELLQQINLQASKHPDFESKIISKDAKIFTKKHNWPGNIRELWNTLSRAVLWTDGKKIEEADIIDALISRPIMSKTTEINLATDDSFDLPEHIDNTKKSYIMAALKTCAGSKTKAAKMLNIKNHQTLSNWLGDSD